MIKVGLRRRSNYSKVISDFDGWVDAKKFMPGDFDLCFLKIKGKRVCSGWAIGLIWEGLRLREGDEVLYWKKQQQGE